MALRCSLRSLCKTKFLKSLTAHAHYDGRKYLLSPGYSCQDAWDQRLQGSVLQGVNAYDFATKLKDKLDKEGKITSIDMDILANKMDELDSTQLDFAEDLFYRFRHTKEAIRVTEATPHALIRSLLKFRETEKLLTILQNKIHFGIFLDSYTANILLDYFIEQKRYQEAAQIAYDLMLQEDFVHPITTTLSFYACHLRFQEIPTIVEEISKPADDEELKYRKVQYIENPWYDDHFDIPSEQMKLGKSLTLLSKKDDILCRGYRLIGWGLYQKFNKAIELLQQWTVSDLKEIISRQQLEKFKSILENVQTRQPPAPKEPGLLRLSDLYPFVTEEQKVEYLKLFQDLSGRLISSGKVVDGFDSEKDLRKLISEVINNFGAKDIEDQKRLFVEWEKNRENKLEEQIRTYQIEQKKKDIAKKLIDLTAKEEKLRYFEQKAKIDLQLSLYGQVATIEEVVEEEQFVAPPSERKSSADAMKKKK